MASSKKETSDEQEIKEEPVPFFGGLFSRIILGFILAALGAVLLTLAFPPYEFWPLVLCGFVPILISVHRIMPRRFAGLAMGIGVGGFFWGYFNGVFAGTNAAFMEYLPYVVALIFLLVGGCQRVFHAQTGYRWFIIEGVVVWVGFEMLRGLIPFLGTAAFLANPLYEQFWLIQPVSILSIFGMSLLVIMINYVLAQKAIAFIDSKWMLDVNNNPVNRSAAQRWLYFTIILFLLWSGFSMSIIDAPQASLRVAAVQPGQYVHEIDIEGKITKVSRNKIEFQEDLDQLIELTRTAGEQGAQIIVWNQASLPFDPHARGTNLLRDLAKETDAYLIIGYHVEEDDLNEVTILSPDGIFLGDSYQTVIGNIGTATANDLDFTGRIRGITREDNRIIAVSSQEWPGIASKRFPHIVFRAVENRVPIIKADAHYASGIIDSYGRIIQRSVTDKSLRKMFIADVSRGSGNTPVLAWGDWLGWLCLAGMVAFMSIEVRTVLRERGARSKEKDLSA